jgi:hypothetical protein
MTRIRNIKTTFTAGEVSRDLLGRGDLRAYENGALTLRNVFIQPTGGVVRRAGLEYLDHALGQGRLLPFEFNTDQTYLIVLSDAKISIYADDALLTRLDAPWNGDQIKDIAYTQSADTLLLVHPDIAPQKLTRNAGGVWALEAWAFYVDEANRSRIPFYKFAASEVTLTPSGTSGTITLTASVPHFTADYVGLRLKIADKQVIITQFNSQTVVSATVLQTLNNATPTQNWAEQAFSNVRGYPMNVAFHQDRLVLGGSRELPNRLWFSKSGDLFNFDLGTGLDNESIEFAVLSDQVNAIRGLFSGRHLQVFTSGAEWMVTGTPLTPETVQLNRQTRIGSLSSRHIPPVNVDGATLFIARNGREIREFLYTDLEQAYQATDLVLLSRHIIKDPLDQDFDPNRRLLFVVRGDGQFASLTIFRAEQVAAWTLHQTDGKVLSIAVVGNDVYMLVERAADNITIERLADGLYCDSALKGQSDDPKSTWSGLDHLNGKSVTIIGDGIVFPNQIVVNGSITLDQPVSELVAGLPYTHIIEPLPPSTIDQSGAGIKYRLVKAWFRIQDTAALNLDVGRGLQSIPLSRFQSVLLGSAAPLISRDIEIRALGWIDDATKPLWRIEQDQATPFKLLGVSMELKVNE